MSILEMEQAYSGRYEIGKIRRKKEKKKEANRKSEQTQIIHKTYTHVYIVTKSTSESGCVTY